jgi:hypothetical protein
MVRARTSRSSGQFFGKVVQHVVALDAERVLDELGGVIGVGAADGLFEYAQGEDYS